MLQVLIDIGNAPPKTGTGVYASGLIHALKQYSAKSVVVSEAGISSVSNAFRPTRRLLYLWRLKKLAGQGYRGADVVHFANAYVPGRQSGIRYVVTIHDLDAIQHPEVYTRRYSMYYDVAVRSAICRADTVVTVTEAVRQAIMERYKLPDTKVVTVGNGLNPAFVEAARSLLPVVQTGPPILLFVGRLEKKKNVAWLIKTVYKGVHSGALPDCRLVLAGNRGFGFGEILQQIHASASITQWVQSPDVATLAALYQQSSVVILPSICEGFGIPLIEAMHCRKPILASSIPASREVAEGVGFFFTLNNKEEFYEAVRQALDRTPSPEYDAAVRRQLFKYDWQRLARIHSEVYENICGYS